MKQPSIWLALTAAGAVLAFGGTGPGAFTLVACAVVAIAVVEFWPGERPAIPRVALAVVLTLALLPLLQMIPMPGSLWQVLAPTHASTYQQILGPWNLARAAFPLSIQTQATLENWVRLICYLLVFLLALSWERRLVPSVLPIFLVTIGLFEAVYGLVQYLTGFQYIFTYAKQFYTDDATGTYINCCKFAGLLEMVLPFQLAMILFPRRDGAPARRGSSSWLAGQSFSVLGGAVAFAVVFLGLVFSKCRMALISIAAALALVAALALLRRGKQVWPVLLAVLSLPLLYSLWVGIAPVSERFQQLDPHVGEQGRLDLWKDTLALIRDHPLLGTGLGTYNTISSRYQTHLFQYHIDHAHNDYLEYAAELGVPAALLLFGSLWWLTIRLAGSLRQIERRSDLVLATGCCGAILSLLLHSFTDFNLAIPANALVLAWICGTASGLRARIQESQP